MGATTTTLATPIAEFMQATANTLDEQTTGLRALVPATASPGGLLYEWPVHYAGNASSVSYAEGDAVTATGQESYATAQIAYSTGYYRTMYGFTGHAMDAAKNGYFNAIEAEASGAIAAHLKKVETGLITQLEAAVDSAGSYAGLLRATYKMASYEAAAGGALAVSDLDTAHETLAANPIGADMSNFVVISPVDTHGEYNDVAAGTGAGDPIVTRAEGSTIDGGRYQYQAKYAGAPWIDILGMTSGGLIYIDPSNMKRVVQRAIKVEAMGVNDDSLNFAITSSEILVVPDPRRAAKITT
jgi:hypothetical protein